jgi:uncharacterized membrane protein YdbT with pleckstrin-like domain
MKSFLSLFIKSDSSFIGEENGENVILLVRRHPFFIILRFIMFVVLALIPIILGTCFYSYITTYNLSTFFIFALSFWFLFLWAGFFYSLTMYTLDVWIVTDRRIIDSTQHGFFSRNVSELHVSRIQDISTQTAGVIQTFFKFGDLQVQTAGTEEKFKFSQIPHPERVKDEIMKLVSTNTSVHS